MSDEFKPTPPVVCTAINTIAAHLTKRGYESCVITPGGGTTFGLQNILDQRQDLYRIIGALETACEELAKAHCYRCRLGHGLHFDDEIPFPESWSHGYDRENGVGMESCVCPAAPFWEVLKRGGLMKEEK